MPGIDDITRDTKSPLEHKKDAMEMSEHITRSFEYIKRQLHKYYKEVGEKNGMSYNAMLKLYNATDDVMNTFVKIDTRVQTNLDTAKQKLDAAAPRRSRRAAEPNE